MKPNLAQIFPEPSEEKKPTPIDGDGNEPPDEDLAQVIIDIALNGYTVVYQYSSDTPDEKYVFTDFNDVLEQLRSKH